MAGRRLAIFGALLIACLAVAVRAGLGQEDDGGRGSVFVPGEGLPEREELPDEKPAPKFPAYSPIQPVSYQMPADEPINNANHFAPPPDDTLETQQSPFDRPLESPKQKADELPPEDDIGPPFYETPVDAPLGYTGRSGILPLETQRNNHFIPIEDRWRIGFPEWDRYGKGHPPVDDYPYQPGTKLDPFNQNVLKGDYPILGQHTFFVLTAESRQLVEPRQVPTATTPFESTAQPLEEDFFGNPQQMAYIHDLFLGLELFHGDGAFRPVDWRVKLTPVFNLNYLTVNELAQVNPDVRYGLKRGRTFLALQEWFVETKLADIGPNYDFVSVRAGSQPFTSDFRGFIFSDVNRAVRVFGNRNSNREQYNLIFLRQLEKDTNSQLNSFHERHQNIVIGNYFIQDFVFPGYTAQFSVTYNHDDPTFKFDKNNVLVRPDPVGVFQPHELDVVYLGWTGDGHINRYNINHAFYWALGHDSLNPLANRPQDISAQMAALELSYDRDWIRFRTSFFWSSGDDNPNNSHATGFDGIFDNPNFAGGQFSYWQRQSIRLFGVNLVQRGSLFPNLRSSKIQGQSNFVNPGLFLGNVGMDFEVTPKFRVVANTNLLWFDNVNPLRQFVFQDDIDQFIGTDVSLGAEYRPFLSNNVICTFGVSSLVPGDGFRNLFNRFDENVNPLVAAFVDLVLLF